MHVSGIIAEFNPLHRGHIAHINETRQKFGGKIVVAMSGNFVQRGEPAIFDKRKRTKTALLAGADIVLEIPVPYVIAGADYFARGSVGLLAATGVVSTLSFGSECGDIEAIRQTADVLANARQMRVPMATHAPENDFGLFEETLRAHLDAGMSFAAARGAALSACLPDAPEGLFTKPNNCLAIEYCKALLLLGSPMEVFTTHRASGGPSATKIRARQARNEHRRRISHIDDFSKIFRHLLHTRDFDLGEGLQNRFRKFSAEFTQISEIIDAVKTKRYTRTRLSRAVLGVILGISSADMDFFDSAKNCTRLRGNPSHPAHDFGAQYIRVLGFRKESADLLGAITKKAALPVITHGAAMDEILRGDKGEAAAAMLAKDFEATDIYRIATNTPCAFRGERGEGIIVV
ncbi:MAG: nucleotidyltransferase family protein [Defluviitaleaceae bacterium]|nr:nucleotidyltransferase family protein [Defluviitaleaceae bacterium]